MQQAALGAVVDHMKQWELNENHILYVVHADATEDAAYAENYLNEVFPKTEVQIYPLSPVFVTQGGPRCVAIQFIER